MSEPDAEQRKRAGNLLQDDLQPGKLAGVAADGCLDADGDCCGVIAVVDRGADLFHQKIYALPVGRNQFRGDFDDVGDALDGVVDPGGPGVAGALAVGEVEISAGAVFDHHGSGELIGIRLGRVQFECELQEIGGAVLVPIVRRIAFVDRQRRESIDPGGEPGAIAAEETGGAGVGRVSAAGVVGHAHPVGIGRVRGEAGVAVGIRVAAGAGNVREGIGTRSPFDHITERRVSVHASRHKLFAFACPL